MGKAHGGDLRFSFDGNISHTGIIRHFSALQFAQQLDAFEQFA